MSREYKAFISYRHLPLDVATAKKLHRRIEHYVIPRALRKNGVRKLGYVFRDQDELPLSSNLSDDIQAALDRAEFLIVICSPDTPKSLWVQREIAYFLQHHDRDHVLALLIGGTPDTSFPPQLTEWKEADGSVRLLEPLAANIVADSALKRDRLFSSESLRILAALIGCSYDELFKREQRYRTRRILAAAALTALLAAGFIGVLLNRNAAIRANYQRALRNQSSYLASESLSLLQEGDRMGAVALAMEALPREGQDRPVVSQAEYALGCALGIYTTPGNANGLIARDAYCHSAQVTAMAPSPDGSLFATVTAERLLSVWDTASGLVRWTARIGETDYFYGIAGYLDDSRLVVWGEAALFCFSARDGALLWKTEAQSLFDGRSLSFCRVCALPEADLVAAAGGGTLFLLNASDGSLQKAFALAEYAAVGDQSADPQPTRLNVSSDGRLAAVPCTIASVDRGLVILDLERGEVLSRWACAERKPLLYGTMTFTADGGLLCVTGDLDADSGLQYGNAKILTRQFVTIHCLDVRSGEPRWESVRSYTDVLSDSNVSLLWNDTLLAEPAAICVYADRLDVFASETGTLLAETDFSAPIVGVNVIKERIYCFCADGQRGQIQAGDLSCWYSVDSFCDDLNSGVAAASSFWVRRRGSGDVIHYTWRAADPAWRPLNAAWDSDEQRSRFYPTDTCVDSGCFALIDDGVLLLHDGDPAHPQRAVDLSRVSGCVSAWPAYTLCGCRDGRLKVFCREYERQAAVLIDVESLEAQNYPWTREDVSLLSVWTDPGRSGWTAVGYAREEGAEDPEQSFSLLQLDDDLSVRREIPVGSFHGVKSLDLCRDGENGYFLYLVGPEESYRIDAAKGAVSRLPAAFSELFARCTGEDRDLIDTVVTDPSGKRLAAAVADDALTLLDEKGNEVCAVESETTRIYTFRFTPDGRYLLTVEADGSLRRYDADTGALLSRSTLYSAAVRETTEFTWSFPDRDFFCLKVDAYMDLVHYEDWTAFAYIPCCYGYMAAEDQFCCYDAGSDGRTYGVFPRHDLPSLLSYGRETLRDWQLSETQRMRYGLD